MFRPPSTWNKSPRLILDQIADLLKDHPEIFHLKLVWMTETKEVQHITIGKE